MQASLKEWDSALEDAQKCVELKPDWAKGYSRLGGALFGQGKHQEAVDAYKKGLEIDPDNAILKKGLDDAQQAMRGAGVHLVHADVLRVMLLTSCASAAPGMHTTTATQHGFFHLCHVTSLRASAV